MSRPSTASGDSLENAISSFTMPPEAVSVLESVIGMNKALEQQIDALRMRLTVETKNHDNELQKVKSQNETDLEKKEDEINDLKDSLVNRETRISRLVREGNEKEFQIKQKEKEIDDLKDLVKQTEDYADQLQKQVGKLRGDRHKLESDGVYKEQTEEIVKLRGELSSMREKISSMEKEFTKARTVIDEQSDKIKGLEAEKGAISERFKEELEKASRAMRSEVERMREVMKQQYIEMRNLREQNVNISSDVRDIKDILLKGTVKPELDVNPKEKEKIDVNHLDFKSPRPVQKSPNYGMRAPMTSRAGFPPKANVTVRASVPSTKVVNRTASNQMAGPGGLPPISRHGDSNTGKWIPAGGAKPAAFTARPPRTLRK